MNFQRLDCIDHMPLMSRMQGWGVLFKGRSYVITYDEHNPVGGYVASWSEGPSRGTVWLGAYGTLDAAKKACRKAARPQ